MKHLLSIALCLLLALPVLAQDKPADPLALQSVEIEAYTQAVKDSEFLDKLKTATQTAFTESDKLLKACDPKKYKEQCAHAITLRQAALALGEAVDKGATQLTKDIDALQKGIRFRVGGDETWQIDWRNRRVVKPAQPKGN
jgi:hypothetical protein